MEGETMERRNRKLDGQKGKTGGSKVLKGREQEEKGKKSDKDDEGRKKMNILLVINGEWEREWRGKE